MLVKLIPDLKLSFFSIYFNSKAPPPSLWIELIALSHFSDAKVSIFSPIKKEKNVGKDV